MNKSNPLRDLLALRRKAEEKVKDQAGRLTKLSCQEVDQLVHELGTHKIELEMQNEELREAMEKLESSHSKYADLYDFSPMGYFSLDS
ncbi:MAG: diguanylate cyclase, partial [Desulfobulbaceae bacterium]|nr:diguanylate cyclase [Desulfobulbaceae bacterium]